MTDNPYEVLGLAHGAPPEEVKRAYRRLAMRWHPDRNPSHEAEARFKHIKAAYELILDPERLAEWLAAQAGGESARDTADTAETTETAAEPASADGDAGSPEVPKAEDIHRSVQLSLEEAAFGCVTRVTLTTPVACGDCDGTGRLVHAHSRPCRHCGGVGRVRGSAHKCEACAGRGFVREEDCDTCAGRGWVEASRSLEVRIPPGLLAGEKLRLAGQGRPPLNDQVAGDLYLSVELLPHDLFTLVGRDLELTVPVSVLQLLAGGEVEIPRLAGSRRLKLQPYPGHGLDYRLKGEGYPGKGGQPGGDLRIRLAPIFPTHLEPGERDALARLQAALEQDLERTAPALAAWRARLRDRSGK